MNFKEFKINENIKKSIVEMGFEESTPIQREAIPAILEGNDFIGIAGTGTGKTCAFGIPMIEKLDMNNVNIQALVLCPTRELVLQLCEELNNLSKHSKILITPIYGGQPMDRQISSLKKKPKIVVGTPGRVMDHLRRKTLNISNISMLVLDEADEMLNMGFREDLDVILKTVNDDRQTMLFSATMSKDILDITKKYQKPNVVKCIVEHKNITSPQIKQYIVKLQENRKLDAITKILDSEDYKLSVIFCNTKRKVDELEESLSLRGYLIKSLHGDMDQKKRDSVMNKFRNGKLNILVATDVAARGIDVENIECVFNYDIPYDEEYYVHRIGRTGRAGKDGIAISFVTPKEMFKIKDIQKYTKCILEDYKFIDNNELKEKKYNKLFDKLSKIVLEENLEKEESIIEEYVSNSEYSLINLCAAFVKDSIADDVKIEDIVIKDINKSRKVDKGNVRLFLTIGKLDEVTRNSLRDYVVETAKVNRSDIHNAEVLDKFSFLTVSESAAKEIIKKLNNTKYNNRKLVIEESTKK